MLSHRFKCLIVEQGSSEQMSVLVGTLSIRDQAVVILTNKIDLIIFTTKTEKKIKMMDGINKISH